MQDMCGVIAHEYPLGAAVKLQFSEMDNILHIVFQQPLMYLDVISHQSHIEGAKNCIF